MCARYTQIRDLRAILALVQCRGTLPAWMPRYNIAPQQEAPVIVRSGKEVEIKNMRWGLMPSWSGNSGSGSLIINARAETLTQKSAFRRLVAGRRCLVPADGFYEWEDTGEGKKPWRFSLQDDAQFCFAGLWDVSVLQPSRQADLFPATDTQEKPLETFVIITTAANELISPVHDRMPVIICGEAMVRWLEPTTALDDLQDLLRPYPAEAMVRRPASRRVNRPGNEGPECLMPDEPKLF